MSKELILKKLEQIQDHLKRLTEIMNEPKESFLQNDLKLSASERNFQLMVDTAVDVNTQILFERGEKTPDSYYESFLALQKMGIVTERLTTVLAPSAKLRNILVHEYDFVEDPLKFYESAKQMIPAYQEYVKIIFKYTQENL